MKQIEYPTRRDLEIARGYFRLYTFFEPKLE